MKPLGIPPRIALAMLLCIMVIAQTLDFLWRVAL